MTPQAQAAQLQLQRTLALLAKLSSQLTAPTAN